MELKLNLNSSKSNGEKSMDDSNMASKKANSQL